MNYIFNISAFTDIGTVRSINQDRILVNNIIIEKGILNLLEQKHAICFVADGVGGNKAGEYAAQFVLESINNNKELLENNAEVFLNDVNDKLILTTKNDIDKNGAATTLSGLYIIDNKIKILHVGDSEIWLLRNDIFFKLTNDQVFDEYTKNSPLTSYFGGKEDSLSLDSQKTILELMDNDIFLICSDGLFKSIKHKIVESILKSDKKISAKSDKILENCLLEGMVDNTSIILLEYKSISYE